MSVSVFTSLVTATFAVPGTDLSVTIRKLAPKYQEAARAAALERSFAEMRQLRESAGVEMIKEIASKIDTTEARQASASDPLLTYDALTLIEHGVVSWTLPMPAERASYEDLDEETRDWLATAILRLTKPSLYQSTTEAEAAQKNG